MSANTQSAALRPTPESMPRYFVLSLSVIFRHAAAAATNMMSTKYAFFPAVTAKGNTSQFPFHPILFNSSIENLSDFSFIFTVKRIIEVILIEIFKIQSINVMEIVDFFLDEITSVHKVYMCIHARAMKHQFRENRF